MTRAKIMTAGLTALSAVAATLTLTAGTASAAPAKSNFAGFSANNDQLVFRSTGDIDNTLTVSVSSGSVPGDENASRLTWTFSDSHAISTQGDYCSHPGGKADVVQCYRDYGLSGTTGDLPLRIFLGAGDDGARITSTYTFDDQVYGEAGNDRIRVASFVGVVGGGAGNDTLLGVRTKVSANEPLVVDGDSGNDRIDFGDSTAGLRVDGGLGNDSISTGRGADRILGDSGKDRISAGAGNDRITGSFDDDYVTAGPGNDTVTGDSGNDTIYGNSGNDRLVGGKGTDKISGGPGRNSITP